MFMLFSYQNLGLRMAFPLRFSHRNPACICLPLRAAYPHHLILLDFIRVITFGDECNLDASNYVILVGECITEYQEAV
jgi:hypothetical protein